jgi:hypothetical protein
MEQGGESELPTKLFRPPSLQRKTKVVLNRYKERFTLNVNKEPFSLDCKDIEESKRQWFVPANKLNARRHDKTKQHELHKMIRMLIALNVIKSSKATHYSHPFVVPKPDDKWRLVLDYKNLNNVTSSESWPIPNI